MPNVHTRKLDPLMMIAAYVFVGYFTVAYVVLLAGLIAAACRHTL